MSQADTAELVRRMLVSVAPDLEGEAIDPDKLFRDQFEIDSMDFLNFVVALSQETGLEIPEADYPRLASLAGAVKYLEEKRAG